MSGRVRLSRLLTLEERVAEPDGSGGQVLAWRAVGALWAEMTARAAREAQLEHSSPGCCSSSPADNLAGSLPRR